jgi:hypothetical protein
MPDGKNYTSTDDAASERARGSGAARPLNGDAWLETLAALEVEFRTVLERHAAARRRLPEQHSES